MGKSTGPTIHRTTYQPSRKDNTMKRITLITTLGIGAVVLAACTAGAITTGAQHVIDDMPTQVDERVTPTPAPTVDLTVDEWNGVPECTDAIADAGGVCHGEPVSEPAPTPEPVPASVPAAAVAPTTQADLPPCATEDSDDCYWDAATMGNGIGRSFVTLHGVTYYADQPAPERRTITLNGVTLEYVDGTDAILYCDQPFRVGIDVDDNGNEWAGCM